MFITTLQHLLLFETMALKMAALSVKRSITQLSACFFRLRPDHRKHTGSCPITKVLLGGIGTWLGNHLGIRCVVGFWTNFGFFREYFLTPLHHRFLSFRTAFIFCSTS